MRVYRSLADVPAAPSGRAVALGTFDGVHLGHRRVIGSAVERARERGLVGHRGDVRPSPASGPAPRAAAAAPDHHSIRRSRSSPSSAWTSWWRSRSPPSCRGSRPRTSATQVLVAALDARSVSVGANFRFGHGAAGDAALLRSRPEFETEVVELVQHGGDSISSSRIRSLLAEGDVAGAAELLGAPHSDRRARGGGGPPRARAEHAHRKRRAARRRDPPRQGRLRGDCDGRRHTADGRRREHRRAAHLR